MTDSEQLKTTGEKLGFRLDQLGVIVVDHGSRRKQSNEALLDVVAVFQQHTDYQMVEPAHMELAEPSLEQAFDKLVAAGAKFVVVHPYFLLPGRHWSEDIPRLAAEASANHPGVGYVVTAPLGIHELMAQVMDKRIRHCLRHAAGEVVACDQCEEQGRCLEQY